jgi:hypothetical protein
MRRYFSELISDLEAHFRVFFRPFFVPSNMCTLIKMHIYNDNQSITTNRPLDGLPSQSRQAPLTTTATTTTIITVFNIAF